MKLHLLDHVRCPVCLSSLKLQEGYCCSSSSQEIVTGQLACCECSASFPIVDLVPILTLEHKEMERTRDAFSAQWRLRRKGFFSNKTIYGFSVEDYVKHFEYVFGLESLDLLRGNVIFEAGCGPGDMLCSLGRQSEEAIFIGCDISDAIFEAAENATSFPNVHFVKANIFSPPLLTDSIDIIFTAGVLHHTQDTYGALKKLYSLLRNGGLLYSWIYPSYTFCVYNWIRKHIPYSYKLPCWIRFLLSWIYSIPTYIFFFVTNKYSQKTSIESLHTVAFRIFDNISPEFQNRYTKEEARRWGCQLHASEFSIVNDLGILIKK